MNLSVGISVYDKIEELKNLYVSRIIYQMLLDDIVFIKSDVKEYCDWGTLEDWNKYKSQYATLSIDIDGTLVKNSGQFFSPHWGQTNKISDNVDIVNKLYDSGKVEIILTTSRNQKFEKETKEQLEREKIKYHQIIFNLLHAKRIVINNYAPSNPFKCCDAINLKRNSNDLKEMLEDSIRFSI